MSGVKSCVGQPPSPGAPASSAPAGRYRQDIEGLRAIAVLAVIVNHFSPDFLPGGFLGVDMFFVISGFVITTSLRERKHYSMGALLLDFYSRRLKRLLPALIVCVLVTGLAGTLFINPDSSGYSHSMLAGFFSLFGVSNIYFFYEAIDYFGLSAKLNLFTHTWSLGVEEQFYLLFPAVLWLAGRSSPRFYNTSVLSIILCVLTVLSLASFVLLARTMPDAAYFLMPPRFFELSIGSLAAIAPVWAMMPLQRRANQLSRVALAMLFVMFCLGAERQGVTSPLVALASATLILTSRPTGPLYPLLTNRWALLIGLSSYSLYLWHWSILSVSRWTIGVDLRTAPFQIAAIFLLGAISYRFIERPFRRAQWSQLATIALGVTSLAASAVTMHLLNTRYRGALYAGSPAIMAAKGVSTLMDDKSYQQKIIWRASKCILSSNEEIGKEIKIDTCTLGGSDTGKPTFLIIGNSYSAAEFEMFSVVYEKGLGKVAATSTWGASAVPEVKFDIPLAPVNQYYWNFVIPQLTARLGEGDVLVMINDLSGFTPKTVESADEVRLTQLEKGLNRLATELRAKGIKIIFQSHNPFMREANCTPDIAKPQWFNLSERPGCNYYSRKESLQRLSRLQTVIENVRRSNANFFILDLFPILCPGDFCGFYSIDGAPLYRDEWSHMSVEANYISRAAFLQAVREALGSTRDDTRIMEHDTAGDPRRADP